MDWNLQSQFLHWLIARCVDHVNNLTFAKSNYQWYSRIGSRDAKMKNQIINWNCTVWSSAVLHSSWYVFSVSGSVTSTLVGLPKCWKNSKLPTISKTNYNWNCWISLMYTFHFEISWIFEYFMNKQCVNKIICFLPKNMST